MAVEKSLTNSQYEDIFNSVLLSNLTPSFPLDHSPQQAISPKDICSQPTESASVENSQKQRNLFKHDTSFILSKTEEKLLNQIESKTKKNVVQKKKKSRSKRENITLHEAIAIHKESNTESSINDSFNIELFENPLSQPPSQFSHRERLEWLQERRNVGLWVFCDRPGCNKQRWLEHVRDPTELPDKWYCEMNPDKSMASCSVREKGPSVQEDVDLIYNLYNCGSVVWGRVDGYPWWPAMVDDDPDTEQYYWLDGYSDMPTHYHVVFFDSDKVSRSWLTPGALMAYKTNPDLDKKGKYLQKFQKRLQFAKRQAEDALKLELRERLATFSFLARWPHQINTPQDNKQPEKSLENKTNKKLYQAKKKKEKSKLSQDDSNSIMKRLLTLCDSVAEDEHSSSTSKSPSVELNFNSEINSKTQNASETTHVSTENTDSKVKTKIDLYSQKLTNKNTKHTSKNTLKSLTKDNFLKNKVSNTKVPKKYKKSELGTENLKGGSKKFEIESAESDFEKLNSSTIEVNNPKEDSKKSKSFITLSQNLKGGSKQFEDESVKSDFEQLKSSKKEVNNSKENSKKSKSFSQKLNEHSPQLKKTQIEAERISEQQKGSKIKAQTSKETSKQQNSKNSAKESKNNSKQEDSNESKYDSESSKATTKGYDADSEVSKEYSKHFESDTQIEPIFEQLKKDVIKSQEKRKKTLSQEKNTFEKPKKAKKVSPPVSPKISSTQTIKKSRSLGLRRIKKPSEQKENLIPKSNSKIYLSNLRDSDTESVCSTASSIRKIKALGLSKNSRKIVDSSDNESIRLETPKKVKRNKLSQKNKPNLNITDFEIFPKLDTPPKKLLNDVSKMFTDSDLFETQIVPGTRSNIDKIIEQMSQETEDFNNN